MTDFSDVFRGKAAYDDLVGGLTHADLRTLTTEMLDTYEQAIAGCTDADVVFVPEDPDAHDAGAAGTDEEHAAWTIAHIIVHTTAGGEENAFLAAEMARGVPPHGRSRYETHWQTVTTIAQLQQRLAESRRMRLALLDAWPDQPNLDIREDVDFLRTSINAIGRFMLGLAHEGGHVAQLQDAVRQARTARDAQE